jgi:hypothetical protein
MVLPLAAGGIRRGVQEGAMRLCVADDWAEDHHDIEVMDEAGKVLARKRLPEGVAGIGQLHELTGRFLPAGGDAEVQVGIETDRGPWGYGRVPPSTFVAAWRHIVSIFRALSADNVTWLWTINADQTGTGPVASWWPGANYVTWVGIDGYYYLPSDTFARVFGHTIDQVREFTSKPVLLSGTAVAPGTGSLPGSSTFSRACVGTTRSGWCGSTGRRRAPGPAMRTGGLRTAPQPKRRSDEPHPR